MSVTDVALPAGFVPWQHRSPVIDALGPFARRDDDPLCSGFLVTANKLNGRGFLHAGVISTFADVAIGHALSSVSVGARYVTIGLSCEFLGTATVGEWIDAQVTPHKTAGRVVSGSIVMSHGRTTIATAQALFVPV